MAFYHADDFGITVKQSEQILACSSACGGQGVLSSTSMFVNSPAFHECADLIRPFVQAGSIKLGLHLNLVEGRSLVASEMPGQSFVHVTGKASCILVDDFGNFQLSFAQMLAIDTKGGEKSVQLREEIFAEVKAQISTFIKEFPELRGRVRIDSHQHFHMIPSVFSAVLKALDELDCTLEYIRIAAEPVSPFLTPSVMKRIPQINVVKNGLLNTLALSNKPVFDAWCAEHDCKSEDISAVFYGLMFSGCMYEFVKPDVFEKAVSVGVKQNKDVEILFHPGHIDSIFDCFNLGQSDFVTFNTNYNRFKEAEALQGLV